ncbi:MAG TPA: CHASE3 domain-containing protein, partial [Burkholderiales bacterium]|nr:CHASE3 domain-containing protein [Burkholderiales bacterium]
MRPLPLPTSWSLLLVLGLLATLAGGAAHLLGKMSEVSEARHAAYLRLEQLGKVRSALLDAEAQSRGYVVSAEPACLTAFQNAHAEVLLGMEALKGLYRDNREGVARLAKIEGDARIQLDQLAETIRLRQGQGFEQAKRKMQL